MTANTTPFDEALLAEASDDIVSANGTISLAQIRIGEEGVVEKLTLESELAAWLRAVGIGEGDRVSVLRIGAFGGPLHVRNAAGGEFALNRQLAHAVLVKRG